LGISNEGRLGDIALLFRFPGMSDVCWDRAKKNSMLTGTSERKKDLPMHHLANTEPCYDCGRGLGS